MIASRHRGSAVLVVLVALPILLAAVFLLEVLRPPTSLDELKTIVDRSIHLYLTLCFCLGLGLACRLATGVTRRILAGFLALATSGAAGIWLAPGTIPEVAYVHRHGEPIETVAFLGTRFRDSPTTPEGRARDEGRVRLAPGNFAAVLRFDEMPPDFAALLERARDGEVTCILAPKLFRGRDGIRLAVRVGSRRLSSELPPVRGFERRTSGRRFLLDRQAAAVLLDRGELVLEPVIDEPLQTFLVSRHVGVSAAGRDDRYVIDGVAHRPPDDGLFFVAFLFEETDGTPLAVYL